MWIIVIRIMKHFSIPKNIFRLKRLFSNNHGRSVNKPICIIKVIIVFYFRPIHIIHRIISYIFIIYRLCNTIQNNSIQINITIQITVIFINCLNDFMQFTTFVTIKYLFSLSYHHWHNYFIIVDKTVFFIKIVLFFQQDIIIPE